VLRQGIIQGVEGGKSMTTVFLRRTLSGLIADDEEGQEIVSKIKIGDVVKAEITRPRNPVNHRRFFALVSLVYKNTDGRYLSAESLREIITIGIGHCDTTVIKVNGETFTHHVARSISWAKMDDTAFSVFWNRAVDYIISEVLPVSKEELEREVFLILGIDLEGRR
jgi:hypothetical protein